MMTDQERARLALAEYRADLALAYARGARGVTPFAGTWTEVTHAMSPFSPSATQTKLLVDSTAGPVTIHPNAALADQSLLVVKDWKGQSALNPITVDAPGGTYTTIEETQNPGNQGASATISTQGDCVTWQYNKATGQLIMVIS
jgi:hypothetical protein